MKIKTQQPPKQQQQQQQQHNNPKPMEHCKSSATGNVHSNTGLPQETRNKSSK